MKKQSLLFGAIIMAMCSYGQILKMPVSERLPQAKASTKTQTRTITPTDGQFWWGYFNESLAENLNYSGGLGYSKATVIDAAIYVPDNHFIVGNGTIKALRFWLCDDISMINSDMTIWISSTLPSSARSADYSQIIPQSEVVARFNEVELATPFNVNKGCYIGISFSISGKSYPVMSYGNDNVKNAFFYRVSDDDWVDFAAAGYGYGVLALQMLIDGISLSSYSVSLPPNFGKLYALIGTQVNVPITITNEGCVPVTSLSYTTYGNTSEEQTINIPELATFCSRSIDFSFDSDTHTKHYGKALTITKVNGQPNTSVNNSALGSMITISEKPVPVPVVEEFTGTWCGYCPYGYVGMEKTHKTYGDNVVLIAAHNGDPMAISDYNPIMAQVSGFPSSFVNRVVDAYPSASILDYNVRQSLNRITVGSIKAKAMWASDDKTEISIDTDTKFFYSDNKAQYGIAYVLIENGMTGTGSSWAQSNYLSGRSGDSDMAFFYNSGAKVTDLTFNFVAVGAWGIANGVNGSVNNTFKDGEVQRYNFKADISSNSVIQDKSKLTVAVLLIDQSTGCIVNAAQVTIQDYNPAAISDVYNSPATRVARYTVGGRQVSVPQCGLNIIRFSDGTVRKMMVK